MDPTDHSHVPYVFILVRVLEDWKKGVRHLSCHSLLLSSVA